MEKKLKVLLNIITITLILGVIVTQFNRGKGLEESAILDNIIGWNSKYRILDKRDQKYLLTNKSSIKDKEINKVYLYDEKIQELKEIAQVEHENYFIKSGRLEDEYILYEYSIKMDGGISLEGVNGYDRLIFVGKFDDDKIITQRYEPDDFDEYDLYNNQLVISRYDNEINKTILFYHDLDKEFGLSIYEYEGRITGLQIYDEYICFRGKNDKIGVLRIDNISSMEKDIDFNELEFGFQNGESVIYDNSIYSVVGNKESGKYRLIKVDIESQEQEVILAEDYNIAFNSKLEIVNGNIMVIPQDEDERGYFRGYVNLKSKKVTNLDKYFILQTFDKEIMLQKNDNDEIEIIFLKPKNGGL